MSGPGKKGLSISAKGALCSRPLHTQLPKLIHEFDAKYLARYTPCTNMSEEQIMEAIAVTHVELILIHPFREGNGRLSRLLADVMAVQGTQAAGLSKLGAKQSRIYFGYPRRYVNGLRPDVLLGRYCVKT